MPAGYQGLIESCGLFAGFRRQLTRFPVNQPENGPFLGHHTVTSQTSIDIRHYLQQPDCRPGIAIDHRSSAVAGLIWPQSQRAL